MKSGLISILLGFFLLSFFQVGHTQQFNYGLGISHQTNFFQYHDRKQFVGSFYRPALSENFGIQAFIDWEMFEGFQVRLLTNTHLKTLSLKTTPPGFRASKKHGDLNFFFLTTEFKIYGRYLLTNDKWDFFPKLGFGIGLNTVGGIGGTIGFAARSVEVYPSNYQGSDFLVYTNPSIFTGLSIRPPFNLFKRPIELDIDISISPRDFLDHPILIESGTQNLEIQGKYHYISFAFNYFFRKENPND